MLLLIFSFISACTSERVPNKDNNKKEVQEEVENNQIGQVESEELQNEKNDNNKKRDGSISEIGVTQMFFLGQSNNWLGELYVNETGYIINVYYILDDPEVEHIESKNIGEVQYIVRTNNKTIEGEGELLGNSIPLDNREIPLPSEDKIITVTVKWKDKVETFTMKNKLQEEGVISSKEAIDMAKEHMETNLVYYPILEARYIPFSETWTVLSQDEKVGNDYYFVRVHAKTGEIVYFEGRKGKADFYGPK